MTNSLQNKRKKLNLSQEQLAQRLGITRQTLAKIEKGERPLTENIKEKLTNIFESLEDHGYIRNNMPEKNLQKFKQVLLYILQQVGARPNVGMTVIYKLLYFIDFDYYEKYHTQLMGLTYFKNTHGPTPREFKTTIDFMKKVEEVIEIKSKYFTHEQKKFLPNVKPDLSLLSGQELLLIDDVLKRYADKSATELSELSHRDTPWKLAEHGKDLEYEYAFYRPDEFSVGEYSLL
jgi:transcriptional regulator with XRE-family HTH domain